MIQYPHLNPIALKIGPLRIHWYGIMYLLGFAAGWALARKRASKPGSTWRANDVDDVIFFAMLGVILGGRIGYVLFYGLGFWAKDPLYPFKIWDGGMSLPGGDAGTSRTCWTSRRRCLAWGCCSAASATSSTASCGASRPPCPGASW